MICLSFVKTTGNSVPGRDEGRGDKYRMQGVKDKISPLKKWGMKPTEKKPRDSDSWDGGNILNSINNGTFLKKNPFRNMPYPSSPH